MLRPLERPLKRSLSALLRPGAPPSAVPLPAPRDVRSVLVVRQHNQLGDMLCVVPLLRSLRAAYPRAVLMLLTSPVNHAVMLHSRYLDEVLEYDKRRFLERGRLHPGALWSYLRALRAHRFDLVIAPATVSVSFSTDLLCRMTGAPVRIGAGALDGVPNDSSSLYTHPVTLDWRAAPGRHQTLRNFDVAAGLPGVTAPDDLRSDITLTDAERRAGEEQAAALRGERRLLFALHPGAGKEPNRWPADRFAEAADRLAATHDAALVLTAGPMDEEPVRRMRANLRTAHAVLERRPIREVAAVLARADLLISNDTGIMHVGAAAGARVLSLFGPTPPEQWAPAGPGHRWLRGAGGDITAIPAEEVTRTAGEMVKRLKMEE